MYESFNSLIPRRKVKKNYILISLTAIFFITTILFLFLYLNLRSKIKLYIPDPKIYIPIKEPFNKNKIEGGQQFQGKHDILNTPYYSRIDFYNKKSSGSFMILEKFKTYQQTSEYTCGCASLIMALYYIDETIISEKDCAEKSDTGTNIKLNSHGTYGTYPIDLEKAIINYGFNTESNRNFTEENSPFRDEISFIKYVKEAIKSKEPIIVLSNDWGGHYINIIGYDSMGTEDLYIDDVLIVADSYDTSDHVNDGYVVWSLERFYSLISIPYPYFESSQNRLQFIRVKRKDNRDK